MENLRAYRAQLIAKALELQFEDARHFYYKNFEYLSNVGFVFAYKNGNITLPEFNKSPAVCINNFFTESQMAVINNASYLSFLTKQRVVMPVEFIISFDTQILIYLYRKSKGQLSELPAGIDEIIKIINNKGYSIDCIAYMLENTLFNPKFIKSKLYKENIYVFESYFNKNSKTTTKKLLNLQQKIQKQNYGIHLKMIYKQIYLALLVMVDLTFNYKSLDVYTRELKFLEYFHENIHIVPEREANLAKLYFLYDRKIKFFGKIQKGRTDIIKSLQNMAWDIFHIHNTMQSAATPTAFQTSIVIPLFITFDNRLKDIFPLYQINGCAYIENTFEYHFAYSTNLLTEDLRLKYFCLQKVIERSSTRDQLKLSDEKLLYLIEHQIQIFEGKVTPPHKY